MRNTRSSFPGVLLPLALSAASCTAIMDAYGLPSDMASSSSERKAQQQAQAVGNQAFCLAGAGKLDLATTKLDAYLTDTRKALGPASETRLGVEILVASWYSTQLARSADAARQLQGAITAFEGAHGDRQGISVATVLSGAYRTLGFAQHQMGDDAAADKSYAAYQHYDDICQAQAARITASVPPQAQSSLAVAFQMQANMRRLADLTHETQRGDGDIARRQLESGPTTGILDDYYLFELEMAAGNPRAALTALEEGGGGLMSEVGSPAGITTATPALYGPLELFGTLYEANALTLAVSNPGLDRADQVAFFLAEQRKGRYFDTLTFPFDGRPETASGLAAIRAARAQWATDFLRGLTTTPPDPIRDCESPAASPLKDYNDPHQQAIRTAEQRLVPPGPPPKWATEIFAGTPRESIPKKPASSFLQAIEEHLARHQAFVSFVRYDLSPPVDLRSLGAPRPVAQKYAAFVVAGGKLTMLDLGGADEVEQLVEAAVRPPNQPPQAGQAADATTLASWQALYDRVWRPLLSHLAGATQIAIATDGALNRVPFAAFYDGRRWLYEHQSLSMLHSARDLLAPPQPADAGNPPLVLASPVAPAAPNPMSPLSPNNFPQLRGMEGEAKAVQALFPGSTLLLGAQADEASLLAATAPAILHVASHAAFLPPSGVAVEEAGTRGLRAVIPGAAGLSGKDPFHLSNLNVSEGWLRSALVLAQPASPPWDGFATAYEIQTMNLHGTQLVTLSACETGTGQPVGHSGEASLQRAFLNAGAESVIASLWEVNDQSTALWMETLYSALLAGRSRAEAMNLAMSAVRARYPHPYHWAAFTLFGSTGPLRPFAGTPIGAHR